jgi:hypothetical protein
MKYLAIPWGLIAMGGDPNYPMVIRVISLIILLIPCVFGYIILPAHALYEWWSERGKVMLPIVDDHVAIAKRLAELTGETKKFPPICTVCRELGWTLNASGDWRECINCRNPRRLPHPP